MSIQRVETYVCDLCEHPMDSPYRTCQYYCGISKDEIELRYYEDYLEVDLCKHCVKIVPHPDTLDNGLQQLVATRIFKMRGRTV